MDWIIAFAAGAAAGLAVWPLTRVLSQAPLVGRTLGVPLSYLRFRRAFGIAPSRDPDIHRLLQPTVDKHLSYLREAARNATKDLERLQGEQARSLITASRTATMLRRSKKRMTKATKQLSEATALASAWGFLSEAPSRPVEAAVRGSPVATPPPIVARRRRTAVAATSSGDGTRATT
ncbi:MAG: hypothetical protein WEE64_07935 [Dehalococcoidia bacterium]